MRGVLRRWRLGAALLCGSTPGLGIRMNSITTKLRAIPPEHAEQYESYQASADHLAVQLARPDLSGTVKHQLHCQHRFHHGRQPNVCKRCWSYHDICQCPMVSSSIPIVPGTRVILWVHHKEWGSPSNTGSILQSQDWCDLRLKGLPEHDTLLETDLSHNPALVLWPSSESINNNHNPVDPTTPLTLIALEGTWNQARKMATRLRHVPRLSLDTSMPSLIAPLRHGSRGVCTAQAVLTALVELQRVEASDADRVLAAVRRKVEQTVLYQGHATFRGSSV